MLEYKGLKELSKEECKSINGGIGVLVYVAVAGAGFVWGLLSEDDPEAREARRKRRAERRARRAARRAARN